MPIFVIGLTGAAGSGKSTVARYIASEWGGHCRPCAGAMKRTFLSLLKELGIDDTTALRMLDGDLKETPSAHLGGHTPREVMQSLGKWGRSLSPSLWLNAWLPLIDKDQVAASVDDETCLFVADDVRRANEVAAIRSLGGIIVHINRPGAGLKGEAARHISETEDLGPPDMTIANIGDLAQLGMCVDMIVAGVLA